MSPLMMSFTTSESLRSSSLDYIKYLKFSCDLYRGIYVIYGVLVYIESKYNVRRKVHRLALFIYCSSQAGLLKGRPPTSASPSYTHVCHSGLVQLPLHHDGRVAGPCGPQGHTITEVMTERQLPRNLLC